MDRTLILMGGGLDSTALLIWLATRVPTVSLRAIHFQYGQVATQNELESVHHFTNKYGVPLRVITGLPLSQLAASRITGGKGGDKLEGRNVVFAMLAAMHAAEIGCDKIALGFHAAPVGGVVGQALQTITSTVFPDTTEYALVAMQKTISECYSARLQLIAPFMHRSRLDIFREVVQLDPELFTHSHTCYEAVAGGCGKCSHCLQQTALKYMLKREGVING